MSGTDDVLVEVRGKLGRITLNRPDALNALTLEMVRSIESALDRFEADDSVAVVLLDGAGDRAFCAGGDIRSIYDAAIAGDPAPRTFWAEEYRLNSRLHHFPKPIVALMDGIVMGGGVGLSAHVSHRIVTERATVAMPEVGIGFAPDVGGTWLLSRTPGHIGKHVALTAGRLGAADSIACGLADDHIQHERLDSLVEGLTRVDDTEQLDALVASLAGDTGDAPLLAARPWIDECYDDDSVAEIVEALRAHDHPDANAAAEAIGGHSPVALAVTLRALREAAELPTLEACLEMEYRISTTFLDTPDFVEGVRAAIVDKDRNPSWNPSDVRAVSLADTDPFFLPRPDDLELAP